MMLTVILHTGGGGGGGNSTSNQNNGILALHVKMTKFRVLDNLHTKIIISIEYIGYTIYSLAWELALHNI